MCTINETKVTTTNISAVRWSTRNPTWKATPSETPHWYTVRLASAMLPCSIPTSTQAESRNETPTPAMVSQWAAGRGMKRMPRPATSAAASGASTISNRTLCRSMSALHPVKVFDFDAAAVAEQHHQDGEADGRLRRRHRQDEEHEHLAGRVVEVTREGDEVEVHRQQHEFDAHQEQDHVLAVEEDAGGADGEQGAGERQEVEQRDHVTSPAVCWSRRACSPGARGPPGSPAPACRDPGCGCSRGGAA